MNISKEVVGVYSENCYFLEKNNEVIIIDPGDESEKLLKKLEGKRLLAILITHAHFDHVGALYDILDKYNVPVYYNNINNEIKCNNLINIEEKEYEISFFKFKVIYTKGHRNDLCSFYFYEDNVMFTGDFLFYLSVGRCDLEYADKDEMINSISKIKEYNDDIVVYPGHSSKTTLGFEKKYNKFFKI